MSELRAALEGLRLAIADVAKRRGLGGFDLEQLDRAAGVVEVAVAELLMTDVGTAALAARKAARQAERDACLASLTRRAEYEQRQAHELGRQRGRSIDVQRHLATVKNLKEAARVVAGDAKHRDRQEAKAKASGKPACRVCGCTEARACDVGGRGCHWAEPDLCSACAGTEVRRG